MKNHRWALSLSLITSSALLVTLSIAQDIPGPPVPNPPKMEDGIQVENRGPVHEAFANPGAPVRGGKDGHLADKAPPPPVPELPPEEKPSGDNVQWISGYWQWDIEKKDFIWVSGFWRNTPPGRDWHAGEWKNENGQHRYIPGYWKPSNDTNRRRNLPEPPNTVENGPNVPAPHGDALWIPGHWVYRNDKYVWQPGYWGEVEQDMVWTPGQYNYTGDGYCYVPGYWDYNLEDRGLLFAPVYFSRPLWLNAGWRFCPSFGINVGFGGGWAWGYGGFYDSLFIGPGYGSFWFGNYFGPGYWGCGYRPWCWNGGGNRCSPVYNHYCWQNRNNPNWNKNNQQNYAARNMGALPGPGRNVQGNQGLNGRNINPNTLNNATTLANRIGGDKAGQQLADRVAKGQAIQQVNQTLKQTSSSNVVQPAKDVLKNQAVARNLPSPDSTRSSQGTNVTSNKNPDLGSSLRSAATRGSSGDLTRTMSGSSRPSLASNRDAALRQQVDNAIRSAPTGSTGRGSDGIAGSTRGMSGSRGFEGSSSARSSLGDSMQGSRSSSSAQGSLGRSFGSPGGGNVGSSRGSFSGGSSMGGSRGGFSGGSMGGAGRGGGMGGGMGGGGGARGGGGGGGKR